MQIVKEFVIRKVETIRNEPFIKKVRGRIVHTEKQKEVILKLFAENTEIYLRCKKNGKSSMEDRLRHKEIVMELERLKAV